MLPPPPDLDILLVSMPWVDPGGPSIQLGVLQTVLEARGLKAGCLSAYLDYCDHLLQSGVVKSVYDCLEFCTCGYAGEWVFATPSYYPDQAKARRIAQAQVSTDLFEKLERIQEVTPGFIDALAASICAARPRVVGFTTTLNQTIASLALSHRLKELDPGLRILFGGAHCEGILGRSLMEQFPWIDAVLHGEGELLAPALVRHLACGEPLGPTKGMTLRREDGSLHGDPEAAAPVQAEDFVRPDYDEYFDRLRRQGYAKALAGQVAISFENSRGCWWGQKQHCTFCSLNGTSMGYRSKPPQRALEDLRHLAEKYHHPKLDAVDNILDYRYFDDFLEALAGDEFNLELFFETKSNLTRDQLLRLKRAGVEAIQPGIESLSSSILKLMKKGVTGIQNLRLLKFCAWLDIEVRWNILSGFPGEDPAEYARMAELVPALIHFDAPNFTPLAVMRFSPYFEAPEKYGLRLKGPLPIFEALFPVPKEHLPGLSYDFHYGYEDGRRPRTYTRGLELGVKAWEEQAAQAKGKLRYFRVGRKVTIHDDRPNHAPSISRLDPLEGHIYRASDEITSIPALLADPLLREAGTTADELDAFIADLVSARLLYREGDQILSLALPGRDRVRGA